MSFELFAASRPYSLSFVKSETEKHPADCAVKAGQIGVFEVRWNVRGFVSKYVADYLRNHEADQHARDKLWWLLHILILSRF